jgi:hypothetical protein
MKLAVKILEKGALVARVGLSMAGFLLKETSQVLVVIGKEFFSSVHCIASEWELKAAKKARWEKTKGVYRSLLIFPDAFEKVENALKQPFTVHRFSVKSDPTNCQIIAGCNWSEDIPGFPHSFHQLDLILDFVADPNGTSVHFEWLINDFPRSLFSKQYIRTMNSWIEGALEVEATDE